jgi:recombination protein RecR
MRLPKEIQECANVLSELPGIGPRQATRLAFYLAHKGKGYQHYIANILQSLDRISFCTQCHFVHAERGSLCSICSDNSRDMGRVAVVEKETDLVSLERARVFNGRYMILGGSKKPGVLDEFQKTRLEALKQQARGTKKGTFDEIIIAVNPTTAGDIITSVLTEYLADSAARITRLGRGIPTGGEIEFADEETIKAALTRRD